MNTNHPFQTFENQIAILKKRGMIIDDPELALESISSFSYYTIINGYKDLFLDPIKKKKGIEQYKKGTEFSMLSQAHWLDLSMSSLIFKYTLAVEKKLKTQVAYLVAKNNSIEEDIYLSKTFYGNNKANRGKLLQLRKNINEAKEWDISAKHYWKAEGNVPPWIAAKAISFGNSLNWYSILTEYHKNEIIKAFQFNCSNLTSQDKLRFFNDSLNQVYDYRNLSAHGNRTFLMNLETKQKSLFLTKSGTIEYYQENDKVHNQDLFSIILTILSLLTDKYVAQNMITELLFFFKNNDAENLRFIDKDLYELFGMPRDYDQRLEKYFNYRFLS